MSIAPVEVCAGSSMEAARMAIKNLKADMAFDKYIAVLDAITS